MAIQEMRPVTINIEPSIHNAMKYLAKSKRVHISLLYEQAAEAFLNLQNGPKNGSKNVIKKTVQTPVPNR